MFFPWIQRDFFGKCFFMEITLRMYLIVCPLVFLASLVDAVAGGGGLIALPAYLVAGLPPHLATATNKCSSSIGTVVSTARFIKNGKIHRQVAVYAAVTALVGSVVGTRLNLLLSEAVLHYILIILLPVIALFLLFNRDFGRESREGELPPRTLLLRAAVLGWFTGMYDGFFGPGAGTFMILGLTALCRFDLITASGTAKVVNLCSNAAAFVSFALAGKIVWALGLPAAVCSIAGHYVGSELALKDGAKVIRPMFFVVLVLLLGRILWDLLG